MKSAKFWTMVVLMSFTALVLHVRGDVDHVPPSRPLSELPWVIGNLRATDIPFDAEQLQVLGKGDFLNRVYHPQSPATATPGERGGVDLYIAYFPTQRTGQSIHSPQNCLPGAGWTFAQKGIATFTDANGKEYQVGEYLINNGNATDEALYWYQMQGRSIANDYRAKLYTLADSIRYGRTDAALVRIITPVDRSETQLDAHNRAISFAKQIVPLLPEYVPN